MLLVLMQGFLAMVYLRSYQVGVNTGHLARSWNEGHKITLPCADSMVISKACCFPL